jgi:uncharacterized protein (TIGR03437 family)
MTVGGTSVSVNGIAAPVLYASATQVAAIVPYAISGTTAQVTVTRDRSPRPSQFRSLPRRRASLPRAKRAEGRPLLRMLTEPRTR